MSINNKLIILSNWLTHRFREKAFTEYTVSNFETTHVQHLVSLKDRIELLKYLPSNAIVAEIGVNEGDFSTLILEFCTPQKLILIDVWASKRYHGGLFEKVKSRFNHQLASGQIEIMRDLSFGAIASCPDQTFDWVYLDTDHTYATTRRELELLRPKMKPGGIIAGHDYIIGNWNAGYRYGVIEAVREFCLQYNWEMIFLTHELDIPPSFAIRKIEKR
ncbi:MAG: class I SAM-dependent methyltransferase [Saprospiraceae bacterium]|nr:class I SAM-dependent methyltransferase [Candidatus Opimibacter skivensis]MBP6680167.1 class I SAM-dependent methyltransferase [Saprospiraceae bacterium]MBP8086323.1 class I SAM-dependent methyltransferase [Saprospiraceae bacterium]